MEFWTFMEFMAISALVLKLAYQLKSGLVMPMLQDKAFTLFCLFIFSFFVFYITCPFTFSV